MLKHINRPTTWTHMCNVQKIVHRRKNEKYTGWDVRTGPVYILLVTNECIYQILWFLAHIPMPVLESIYLSWRDGRLSWPRWLVTYRDGLPAHRRSPATHPSTNPAVHDRESNSRHVDHKSDALRLVRVFPQLPRESGRSPVGRKPNLMHLKRHRTTLASAYSIRLAYMKCYRLLSIVAYLH